MPKRGERAVPPVPPHGWTVRFLNKAAALGWQDLCAVAAGPTWIAWGGRIEVAPPATAGTSMLVRPDGYVAWATDDPDHESGYTAFTWWCGPPTEGS